MSLARSRAALAPMDSSDQSCEDESASEPLLDAADLAARLARYSPGARAWLADLLERRPI